MSRAPRFIRPRKPITHGRATTFKEAATDIRGMLPCEFLRAATEDRYVVVGGDAYEPTPEQRRHAAEHLIAALTGRRDEEQDD